MKPISFCLLIALAAGCSKSKPEEAKGPQQAQAGDTNAPIILRNGSASASGKRVRVTPLKQPFPVPLRTLFLTLDRGRWSLQVAPDGAATVVRHDYPVAMGKVAAETFHFPTIRNMLLDEKNWGTEGDLEFYLWFGGRTPSSRIQGLNVETSDRLLALFLKNLNQFRFNNPNPAAMMRFDMTNKANALMPQKTAGRIMGYGFDRGNREFEGRHIPASVERNRAAPKKR